MKDREMENNIDNFDDLENNDMDFGSADDKLDMTYVGDTLKTKRLMTIIMGIVGAAAAGAIIISVGSYVSQKNAQKDTKEWVADYLENTLAESGISDDQMDEIAQRVTPLFFDQFGDEVDLSTLPDEQIDNLIEQMKGPLKEYITEDASDFLSEDIVREYIDKEYGDVAEMNSRLKQLESSQSSMESKIERLKDTAVKGEKGDKGDQGIQGIQGQQGAQGAQGAQGQQGAKGEKGDKGDTGATGATGSSGRDGRDGTDGRDGAKGDKGDKGDQGIQGIQGAKGEKGDQGIQGIQGVKGDDGAQGQSTYIVYKSATNEVVEKPDKDHVWMITFTSPTELSDVAAKTAYLVDKGWLEDSTKWVKIAADSIATVTTDQATGEKVFKVNQNMIGE